MFPITCKAVLFDLDGTLVDSAARIRRLWQIWGRRHGVPFDSILKVMHGRRAIETVQSVAPHLHAENEVVSLEADEIADMKGVQVYPAAPELLSRLPQHRWAIVTSGSRQVAEARLRYVRLPLPDVLITGDDVRTGKPAPDGYLLAARRLKVESRACVVIEDAPAGVKAGKAAGMRVVAVATTHSRDELRDADTIISQLAEMTFSVSAGEIRLRYP
jgi:sugar-phosphatase